MISKSLSSSQRFAALYKRAGRLAEFCQTLYPLLIAHSDDFGRLQGDPFTVKLQCLPINRRPLADFQAALEAMHDVDLIQWYEAGGNIYVQVNKFDEHQSGLHKRTKSKFPEPPRVSRKFREFPDQENGRERNGTEGNGREGAVPDRSRDPWSRIVDVLRFIVSEHSLNIWFAPCALVEEKPDALVIAIPQPIFAEYLPQHYSTVLEQAIGQVCPGKRLQFVLRKVS